MNIPDYIKIILAVYRKELQKELSNLNINNKRIQVVEIEVDNYRLFVDIDNNVYIEKGLKISGKTFGKKIGFLKDCIIYLE
jgi:hypothetical protein